MEIHTRVAIQLKDSVDRMASNGTFASISSHQLHILALRYTYVLSKNDAFMMQVADRYLIDFVKENCRRFTDDALKVLQISLAFATRMSNGKLLEEFECAFLQLIVGLAGSVKTVTRENFNEEYYLAYNKDVAEAVKKKYFSSGLDHFLKIGASEDRKMRWI